MNASGRVEPSLEPLTVEEWVADVRPVADSLPQADRASPSRSRSATPWLLLVGAAGAFAMLMAFQQVVEGSVRDAPSKRARAERVAACGVADTSPAGTVCSDISAMVTPVSPGSSRRGAAPSYAQLAR